MQEQPEVRRISGPLPQAARSAAWACLRAMGCTPDEADDLAQDAVLTLLEKQPDADSGAGLLSWARQAARYLFLTHSRTAQRRAELLRANLRPTDAADQAEQEWDTTLAGADLETARAALRECLSGLDRRGRELLDLHYFHGLPAREAGERLGLSQVAVHTALHRIRSQLRDCITRRLAANELRKD